MDDIATWDIYFQCIVGWQQHPGTRKENCEPLTLEECAELTNEMMRVRREKCPLLLAEQ